MANLANQLSAPAADTTKVSEAACQTASHNSSQMSKSHTEDLVIGALVLVGHLTLSFMPPPHIHLTYIRTRSSAHMPYTRV